MRGAIRIRACLAVVKNEQILLVPHFQRKSGGVQWVIPGGEVEFGESIKQTALREFFEETGLHADISGFLNISEVILLERPYHSITICFAGDIISGELRSEADHPWGKKLPRWFSAEEIKAVHYHPKKAVKAALGLC